MPLPIKFPPYCILEPKERPEMWSLYHNEFLQPSHQIIITIELQNKANVKRRDDANIEEITLCLSLKTIKHFACISTHYNWGCYTFVKRSDELKALLIQKKSVLFVVYLFFKSWGGGVALLCNVIVICRDHTYTQIQWKQTHTWRKK